MDLTAIHQGDFLQKAIKSLEVAEWCLENGYFDFYKSKAKNLQTKQVNNYVC